VVESRNRTSLNRSESNSSGDPPPYGLRVRTIAEVLSPLTDIDQTERRLALLRGQAAALDAAASSARANAAIIVALEAIDRR